MKVNFETDELMSYVQNEIISLPQELTEKRKDILRKSAKILKKNVENELERSTIDKPGYVHMKEDVKISIKDNEQGDMAAVIHGGKKTGYKWHMLANGTSNMQATHFDEKAMKESEAEIDGVVYAALAKVGNNGR